jgi:hypothetical protein
MQTLFPSCIASWFGMSAVPMPPMRTHPQTARVYDTGANVLQGTFVAGAPVLDATFETDGVVYTGGLDGAVKR